LHNSLFIAIRPFFVFFAMISNRVFSIEPGTRIHEGVRRAILYSFFNKLFYLCLAFRFVKLFHPVF